MPPGMVLTLTIMVAYFLVLMAIGYASRRVLKSTSEDYFLASRSTGFIVLLFALFATNQTAFGIIGVPAIGYQLGVGVWGFAASGIGLIAFGYYVIGYRSWVLGRRYHYMTQSEIISDRFGSRLVGILVWALLSIYTVPYIMIGSIGGGEAFSTMTQGVVPYWAGRIAAGSGGTLLHLSGWYAGNPVDECLPGGFLYAVFHCRGDGYCQ